MPDEIKDLDVAVAEALKRVGANADCPRCGNKTFNVLKGFFAHSIQVNPRGVQIGGAVIPTAVLVCNRCGYLVQHDLSTLQMQPVGPQMH